MKMIQTASGLRGRGHFWLPWLLSPVVDESYRMKASLHLSSDLAPGAGPAEEGIYAVITDGVLLQRASVPGSQITRLDRNQCRTYISLNVVCK